MHLEVDGLICAYDGVTALENVSLRVGPGEAMGVLGPNGSGKTTLLRALSGVLSPQRGTVLLDERSLLDLPNRQRAKLMGVVPQKSRVDFEFTAFEVVLMGRSPHLDRFAVETETDFRAVREAMEATGTWELEARPFGQLSGGEQQRVIVARALVQGPRILLLDEPTAHLDLRYQYEIMELITRLRKERQLLVVAVFHDLNMAARYCDKAVLLRRGRIYAAGTLEEVLTVENLAAVYEVETVIDRPRDIPAVRVTVLRSDGFRPP
ncbi:MAG: ABC transporter ATP-binding protein [Thermoplasmata archaeon]